MRVLGIVALVALVFGAATPAPPAGHDVTFAATVKTMTKDYFPYNKWV